MLKDRELYLNSVEKSIKWLSTQVNPDGTVNPVSKGSIAYYKIPWALILGGRSIEAKKIIEWTVKECMKDDGDFKSEKRQKFHLDYYTYPNGWLCLAAHLLSVFDVSYPAWRYIARHQDPKTGGYTSRKPYESGDDNLQDAISTAWTSLVGLHMGKLDEAVRAAEFLKMLFKIQPNFKEEFYYYWSPKRGLITKKPDDEPDDRFIRVNVQDKEESFYYILGAVISFLAKLSTITKSKEHLGLAEEYFRFVLRGPESLFNTESAGKLCYATTHLYRATGDKKYLEFAERFMKSLLSIGEPDGSWVRGGKPTASSTAEFCVWRYNLIYLGENQCGV